MDEKNQREAHQGIKEKKMEKKERVAETEEKMVKKKKNKKGRKEELKKDLKKSKRKEKAKREEDNKERVSMTGIEITSLPKLRFQNYQRKPTKLPSHPTKPSRKN